MAKKNKNKTKKPELSKGEIARFQRFTASSSRAAHRLTRAVEIGLQTWTTRGKKSAYKKRDGALLDAWENGWTTGAKTLREASWAPTDFFASYNRRLWPQRIVFRSILPFWR